MTLVQFDSQDPYEVIHDFKNIKDVTKLNKDTYRPRSMTPLLDAIGTGIVRTGAKLSATDEKDRPEKVIFVILTDGEENASREFSREKIFDMIKEQTDKYAWKFVYLGANQDAIATSGSLGMSAINTLSFAATGQGAKMAFMSMSRGMGNYRNAAPAQAVKMAYFDDKDRKDQYDQGASDSLNKT